MKKFKKLIPALCMLLVSAVMLGSTTFAWFSMNDTATATGMEVTAKANSDYLVISNTAAVVADDYGTISVAAAAQTRGNQTNDGENYIGDVWVTGEDKSKVLPVAYTQTATTLYNKGVTDAVSIPEKTWYTAVSTVFTDKGNGTTNNSTITGIKQFNLSDNADKCAIEKYRLTYKVWLSLAKLNGQETSITNKIDVKATFTDNDSSVRALVVIKQNATEQQYYFDSAKTISGTQNFTVNHIAPLEVVVYLFVDGNGDNVKSSYATEITGKLNLDFKLNGIVA